jgi:hypothetical protein
MSRKFPGYDILLRLFRPAVPFDHAGANWDPSDPHTLWKSTFPSVGIATTPPLPAYALVIRSEYSGRLIRVPAGWPTKEEQAFAMISLRESVERVPPHPGIRPLELDEFLHPSYILADGTHGPYQAARYPQEFDYRRPWLGFHSFPMEICSPIDFYKIYDVGDDIIQGEWNRPLLRNLFEYRQQQEQALLATLRAVGDPEGNHLKEHFGPSLPFVDNLTEAAVNTWRVWAEGRDAVGHTLRYIAELSAISRWLREVKRQKSQGRRVAVSPHLMGVWVGNVENDDDWLFLYSSPLPLHALFRLSPRHPLYAKCKPGTLDNDEYYRTNTFLAHIPGIPNAYDINYPHGHQQQPIKGTFPTTERAAFSLPTFVRVKQSTMPSLRVTVPIDPMHPFTTDLYLDEGIKRSQWPDNALSPQQEMVANRLSNLARHNSYPILPPSVTDLPHERAPFHPITQYLPIRPPGEFKQRVFTEEHQCGIFWPVLLSSTDRTESQHDSPYPYNHNIGNNDRLLSDHPWPLVGNREPPHDLNFPDGEMRRRPVLSSLRTYLTGPPSQKQLEIAPTYQYRAPDALERQWIDERTRIDEKTEQLTPNHPTPSYSVVFLAAALDLDMQSDEGPLERLSILPHEGQGTVQSEKLVRHFLPDRFYSFIHIQYRNLPLLCDQ